MQAILKRIQHLFHSAFGSTSLLERTKDIQQQANAVAKHRELDHLRHEVGDLLASTLQLCNECGWDPNELVCETLDRIEQRVDVYKKLNRKQRVGLLRADFDPIDNHHLAMIQTAIQSDGVDEVWLMPSFETPNAPLGASTLDRVAMCRLAVETIQQAHVFTYEQENEFCGDAYHLIKRILGETSFRDRIEFCLILERSVADQMHRSHASESHAIDRIEDAIAILVVESKQPKPAPDNAWFRTPPHRWLSLPSDGTGISTPSEIRGLLEKGDQAAWSYLPQSVGNYIRDKHLYLRSENLASRALPKQRIAVFSESFSPPTLLQCEQIRRLLEHGFDRVIIHPRGVRSDRGEHEVALPRHRAALVSLAFQNIPNVDINYDDISNGTNSPLFDLTYRYESMGEVWLVVPQSDAKRAASNQPSAIEALDQGQRLWKEARFALLDDSTGPTSENLTSENNAQSAPAVPSELLPPFHRHIRIPQGPSPADLRSEIFHGKAIDEYLDRDVCNYVQRHRLFVPGTPGRDAIFQVPRPELFIIHDERNPRAVELAQAYAKYQSSQPNLILVIGGDGTMLKAIREHWRRRLPFIGLNAGHLGFLMNASLPANLESIDLISQSLPLLRVDVRYPDGKTAMHLAYGDAWIERAEGQAAWLQVRVNGEIQLQKVVGDGMLIATAAGSSAYARAMGAVPVPLDSQSLILAGSNIFQPRFWKPMNLPGTSQITLTSLDTRGKRPLRAFVDGQTLGIVQEISAKQSLTAAVELAFTKEYDPSTKLLKSMFPSDLS
ncbi:MAG: NAD(+)/NADH kinase [Planctomycetota bacterium]|nr:NAD(+)/NADH kinase [Planctomycetota bacterium]